MTSASRVFNARLQRSYLIRFAVMIDCGFTYGASKMAIQLNQRATIVAIPQDNQGNPSQVEGLMAWAVEDENIGLIEVAEDGKSAVFVPMAAGTTRVVVTGDADLGEAVKTVSGAIDITVVPVMADSIRVEVVGIE